MRGPIDWNQVAPASLESAITSICPIESRCQPLRLLSLLLRGVTARKYVCPALSVTPEMPVMETNPQHVPSAKGVEASQDAPLTLDPGKPETLVQMDTENVLAPLSC